MPKIMESFTPSQYAQVLGCSLYQARRRFREGWLPARKVKGRWLVTRPALFRRYRQALPEAEAQACADLVLSSVSCALRCLRQLQEKRR